MVIDLADLAQALRDRPEMLMFLVIGLGCLVGNLRIGSIEIGRTAGVLLVGLFFGHYEFRLSAFTETIGFIFFIYCVGVQAGPRFLGVFLQDGPKYFALAVVVAATGFALSALLVGLFGFEPGVSAGLLAGALTSTPTLAAAQSAVLNELAGTSDQNEILTNITTSYAITYVFGMVGLLLFIRFVPRLLRVDLAAEAARIGRSRRVGGPGPSGAAEASKMIIVRAYRIDSDDVAGNTLGQLHARTDWRLLVQRIKRGGEILEPAPDVIVQKGDLVAVAGFQDEFERRVKTEARVPGPEVFDRELIDVNTETSEMVVTRNGVAGLSLRELGIMEQYGCFVNRLSRLGIELPVNAHARLEKGDVLLVTGAHDRLTLLGEKLGHIEREVEETDLLTFALGICLGVAIGSFAIKVGNLTIGLGMAGGLLLAGLALGFLRSLYPTFGRVPPAARWVFMELGLLFFMASVGLRAGAGIVEALASVGPMLFVSGVLVTTVPVFAGYAFGRAFLGLNPVLLLGGITGAMTSTPSLNILTGVARSALPALGYTGAYAFANVLLTVAGAVIVRL